jgi:hypothetical protein
MLSRAISEREETARSKRRRGRMRERMITMGTRISFTIEN